MKNRKNIIPRLHNALKRELREHRSSFIIYTILRALVIGVLIFTVVTENYESAFLCLLTLVLLIVPSFLQVALRIELPTMLEITMLIFIFAAEILGEIFNFTVFSPSGTRCSILLTVSWPPPSVFHWYGCSTRATGSSYTCHHSSHQSWRSAFP